MATHLLHAQAASHLIIVASNQALSSGINLATRGCHQIPMPRVSLAACPLIGHVWQRKCCKHHVLHDDGDPSVLMIDFAALHKGSRVRPDVTAQSTFGCLQGAFDDTKGSLAVQQCATEGTRGELAEAAQRTAIYLALGAAGALLTYLQQAGFSLVTLVTGLQSAAHAARQALSRLLRRRCWMQLQDVMSCC